MSQKTPLINFNEIESHIGIVVRIRGFVSNVRNIRTSCFIILREGDNTVQCYVSKKIIEENKDITKIPIESFIEIKGKVNTSKVYSSTIKTAEINTEVYTIFSTALQLPFTLRDASNIEEGNVSVSYHKCLDNRCLDLRTPHSRSIFKIVSYTMNMFRTYLNEKNFIEIKTSKLIGSSSEGGSNLFEVEFFKKKAYLAQSPQLYKQMAIIGGLQKVYEIGHVYRAEESNINRYLSEFIGLDIEMEIKDDYLDVVNYIYSLLVFIFDKINEKKEEIEHIRKYKHFEDLVYKKEPQIFTFKECEVLLEKNGHKLTEKDFNREAEKKLGAIIKKEYGIDFFVVKEYPTECRPFYTKNDGEYSRSYDFLIRGEEILSGAQRISDYEELKQSALNKGLNLETIGSYLDSFKYGSPPHAGCGIGLERLLKAFFDFNDIRYFNMFPRDPERLNP